MKVNNFYLILLCEIKGREKVSLEGANVSPWGLRGMVGSRSGHMASMFLVRTHNVEVSICLPVCIGLQRGDKDSVGLFLATCDQIDPIHKVSQSYMSQEIV